MVARPVPAPGPAEILIRVEAAGVNRVDCVQRAGNYPQPPGAPDILGLEVAGRVAALGEGADRFKPGDAVMALVTGGGYAPMVAAHQNNAIVVPPGLPMEQAAAIPEAAFTVWSNVFDRAKLAAGEWFLVHGGSSGIGVMAIQLARAFGAKVIATAGSDEKCRACAALGADSAVNYRTEDYVSAVRETTGSGANVILDMVGGDYVERNWKAAAVEGRIVQIATLNGPSTANFSLLMVKRLVHTGSTLRARPVAFKAAIAKNVGTKVLPLLADGRLRVVMDRTFSLKDAAAAHRRMEASAHIGKIVLIP